MLGSIPLGSKQLFVFSGNNSNPVNQTINLIQTITNTINRKINHNITFSQTIIFNQISNKHINQHLSIFDANRSGAFTFIDNVLTPISVIN